VNWPDTGPHDVLTITPALCQPSLLRKIVILSVTVFAGESSWIESSAVAQCHQVAALDGMIHVAGMPDLHPGKGAPIGAAMLSRVLYPFLVGSDIGCGIAVFPFRLKKVVPERLASRFPDLDEPVDGELGTLGRGNHFVELARVEDPNAPDPFVLIVHSGSRGLGERILRAHTEVHGAGPAADPAAYLEAHDAAVQWAGRNRRILAARVAEALGAEVTEPILDVCHNSVEVRDGLYLHRKGAAPGDGGQVLIAGTRGTRSYLVDAHAGADAGWSVAHGAGRKMSRADALRRGKAKHTVEQLRRTPVGSLVVCGDRQLLFEEAPTAYKRIEQVIGDLEVFGLAATVHTTVPVITYKTADKHGGRPAFRAARPGRGR
jgi:release factor H-coupled RctB family protein